MTQKCNLPVWRSIYTKNISNYDETQISMVFINFFLLSVENVFIYKKSELHFGTIMSSKVLSSSLFLYSFVTNPATPNARFTDVDVAGIT